MKQSLGLVSLVVRDYDEALAFFVGKLGFTLAEDRFVPEQSKRWVVVVPPGPMGAKLLLARASTPEQEPRIGNQTGGRVFLFLYTDDFRRDYDSYRSKGIEFVRDPQEQPYGTVAVFKDLYGNLWDLVQLRESNDSATASPTAESTLAAVLEELRAREPIFHRPEHGTTRADFEAMTDPEFWEVGASGRRYGRELVLSELEKRYAAGLPEEGWAADEFRLQHLADQTYLLTYTLSQQDRVTRRSTIWRHAEDGWKIVYHQGTVVETS